MYSLVYIRHLNNKATPSHNKATPYHHKATSNHNKATSNHNKASFNHNKATPSHNKATSNHNKASFNHNKATPSLNQVIPNNLKRYIPLKIQEWLSKIFNSRDTRPSQHTHLKPNLEPLRLTRPLIHRPRRSSIW